MTEDQHLSAYVLARKGRDYIVFNRDSWPVRGYTFVSTHRSWEAANKEREAALRR